ncbi:MAG: MATE family efflux transporter [Saprospiraceae bacterium]|nr:polysaccharide biosynthesis C-terminal domain-containing protein [Lewinella sp.]
MPDNIDLLKDSPRRLMRKLSVPGILGMMVLSVNSLVDSLYLSNLISVDAFAGVTLLFPFTLVVNSISGLITVGSSSVLSRSIGAEDKRIQEMILPNLRALALLGSGVLMVCGLFFPEVLVDLMGATGAVKRAGVDYLTVYLQGAFFIIYGLSANALIRSEGRIRQAMTYTAVGVVLNILLTPIFIKSFGLGVKGAAWSSIISMAVYSLLTSLYFIGGRATFSTGRFGVSIKKGIIGDVLRVGLSAFSMQAANVVRQFILFRSVAWYGSAADLAIFSVVFRLYSFLAVPVMGMLQPLQPVIGVNYGAALWHRCIQMMKAFRRSGIFFTGLLLLSPMIFPRYFMELLLADTLVTDQALNEFRLVLLTLPLLPISVSTIIFFQAVGEGKKASSLPLVRQVLIFLPLVLLVPYFKGISGIYYALAAENAVYALLLWTMISTEMQKLRQEWR